MSDAAQLASELRRTGREGAAAGARRHWKMAQQKQKAANALPATKAGKREVYEQHARANLVLAAVLEECSREHGTMPGPDQLERIWARHRDQFDREPAETAVMLHRRLQRA